MYGELPAPVAVAVPTLWMYLIYSVKAQTELDVSRHAESIATH